MKVIVSTPSAVSAPARSRATVWNWQALREPVAGALIIMGLCWPFLLSSALPIRWWMLLPFALLGGALRQAPCPRPLRRLAPLWAYFAIVLIFAAVGYIAHPLPPAGVEKVTQFIALAGAAYLVTCRQRPITAGLLRGMRWMLAYTLLLGLGLCVYHRDLFLQAEQYGMAELRQAIAVTGFPLIIAMAATWMIPSTLAPGQLFLAGGGLLLAAAVEIFVRGRFDAMVLCLLAVVLVIGPPWRYLGSRLLLCGVLAAIGLVIYLNVLPSFGDSFVYLTWLNPESVGGRAPLFREAWEGFLAHPMGQGIGSFCHIEPFFQYPHNILLESAYELGIIGLLAMLAIYGLVAWRAWRFWMSPPHRVLAALTAIVFLQMLKAGNMATLGFQWVYLYMLLVGTPLSKSWPLEHGEE